MPPKELLQVAVARFAWWIVTGGLLVVISLTAAAATWAERKEQQVYALQVSQSNLEDDVGRLTDAIGGLTQAIDSLRITLRERER